MKTASKPCTVANQGLYNPEHEHDSCGTGFIAQVNGRRSNRILRLGLRSICNLMHRGALDADAKTGDGAGVITQIPYKLFVPEVVRLGHTLYKEGDLAVGVMFLPSRQRLCPGSSQSDHSGSSREARAFSVRLARGADQHSRPWREGANDYAANRACSHWQAVGHGR